MLRTFCLGVLILAASPVLAQNSDSASPSNPTVPVAPPTAAAPPSSVAPPERIAPGAADMSGRLSQQKGMITPPNVDPGMTVSPPRNGTALTPVIPPPGSPGGNPTVVPK